MGDTNRRTGRFIDVFRLQNDKRSGQDSKLLGRWLITTLRHRFFKDKYQNVLQCVKPCVGPNAFGAEANIDLFNKRQQQFGEMPGLINMGAV